MKIIVHNLKVQHSMHSFYIVCVFLILKTTFSHFFMKTNMHILFVC